MQRVTSRRPVLLRRILGATAATFVLCQAGNAGEVWVPARAPQISDMLASRVLNRFAASDVLRVWPAGETLMGCFSTVGSRNASLWSRQLRNGLGMRTSSSTSARDRIIAHAP